MGFANVKITAAIISINTYRNFVLHNAAELMNADPKLWNRDAQIKRAAGRGVYIVNRFLIDQKNGAIQRVLLSKFELLTLLWGVERVTLARTERAMRSRV